MSITAKPTDRGVGFVIHLDHEPSLEAIDRLYDDIAAVCPEGHVLTFQRGELVTAGYTFRRGEPASDARKDEILTKVKECVERFKATA